MYASLSDQLYPQNGNEPLAIFLLRRGAQPVLRSGEGEFHALPFAVYKRLHRVVHVLVAVRLGDRTSSTCR